MSTVLITGAFGQVGKRCAEILLQRGNTVVALDLDNEKTRATAAELGAAGPGVLVPAFVNLLDGDAIAALMAEHRPAAIVHLAAMLAPASYRNPALARKVNVEGTRNLVTAALALPEPPLFVYASSASVYGSINPFRHPERITAQTPVNPIDQYGEDKVLAETLLRDSGLPAAMLRLDRAEEKRLLREAERQLQRIDQDQPLAGVEHPRADEIVADVEGSLVIPDEARDEMRISLYRNLVEEDPAGALPLLDTFSEEERRKILFESTWTSYAFIDPNDYYAYLQTLPQPVTDAEKAERLKGWDWQARGLLMRYGDDYVRWVQTLPDGSDKSAALNSIIWATREVNDAEAQRLSEQFYSKKP